MFRTVLPLFTVLTLVHSSANAQLLQDPTTVLTTSPTLVNGVLTIGGTTFQTDEASSREELPGLGHKFELLGSMIQDTDPEFPMGNSGNSGGGAGRNEVISSSLSGGPALAFRKLSPGIKILALTNQINLKYYFQGRTCGGGSPRISLFIDSDGDGNMNFAAHGHVNPPLLGACVSGRWAIEDLTDEHNRWEVTPAILPNVAFYEQWDRFVIELTAAFPNHQVVAGLLVDDACTVIGTGSCGKAYFDLVTIENRTLEIWQDTVKK